MNKIVSQILCLSQTDLIVMKSGKVKEKERKSFYLLHWNGIRAQQPHSLDSKSAADH